MGLTTQSSSAAVTYSVSESHVQRFVHTYVLDNLNETLRNATYHDRAMPGFPLGPLANGSEVDLNRTLEHSGGTLTGGGLVGLVDQGYDADRTTAGFSNRTGPWRLTIHSEEHLISVSVILGIMILCCIIGNCFVIAAVILERSLHNVANYLILSLAVADLMVAVLVMPLSVVNEISKYWFLHSEVCDMWISFDVLCCTASILHLVAIAMDRYWAVTSIDYIRRRSARRILLMILAVWVVALTISIPPLFGWRDKSNKPELTGNCIISQDHGYTIFSTVGAFYLPMFIMICIYARIYMVARRRIRKEDFHKKKKRSWRRTKPSGALGGKSLATEHISLTVQPEYSVVSNCNGCSPEKEITAVHGPVVSKHKNGLTNNGPVPSPPPPTPTSPPLPPRDYIKSSDKGGEFGSGQSSLAQSLHPPQQQQQQQKEQQTLPQTQKQQQQQAPQKHLHKQLNISPDHSVGDGDNDSRLGEVSAFGKSGLYTNGIEQDPPTCILDAREAGQGSASGVGERKPCIPPSHRQREKLEQRREKKAARTLAIITGAFLLCWLPFFIVALLGPFIGMENIPHVVNSLMLWLGYLNSLLNPIIYTIFSPEFRNAFRKILFGKYSRRGRGR